jgi:hypothetical protein
MHARRRYEAYFRIWNDYGVHGRMSLILKKVHLLVLLSFACCCHDPCSMFSICMRCLVTSPAPVLLELFNNSQEIGVSMLLSGSLRCGVSQNLWGKE